MVSRRPDCTAGETHCRLLGSVTDDIDRFPDIATAAATAAATVAVAAPATPGTTVVPIDASGPPKAVLHSRVERRADACSLLARPCVVARVLTPLASSTSAVPDVKPAGAAATAWSEAGVDRP